MYCWILNRPTPPHTQFPMPCSLSSSIIKRNARAAGVHVFAAISLFTVYFLFFLQIPKGLFSVYSNRLLLCPILWPPTTTCLHNHTSTYGTYAPQCSVFLNLQSIRSYSYPKKRSCILHNCKYPSVISRMCIHWCKTVDLYVICTCIHDFFNFLFRHRVNATNFTQRKS